MKTITSIMLSILLFTALMFAPIASSAQDQGAFTSNGSTNNGSGNMQDTSGTLNQTEDTSFNAWWLLPLLALPLLFLALRKDATEDEDYEYRNQTSMVGAKGGRARTRRKELLETEE